MISRGIKSQQKSVSSVRVVKCKEPLITTFNRGFRHFFMLPKTKDYVVLFAQLGNMTSILDPLTCPRDLPARPVEHLNQAVRQAADDSVADEIRALPTGRDWMSPDLPSCRTSSLQHPSGHPATNFPELSDLPDVSDTSPMTSSQPHLQNCSTGRI